MKNQKVTTISYLVLTMMILACAKPQGNERLQEKAEIEASGSQNAIDKKAKGMEQGLLRQQRFFQGMAGTYEGKFKTASSSFHVTVIITPSIAVYQGERIRNIDEITYDLTNLTFNIEDRVAAIEPGKNDIMIGSSFSKIKPLVDAGYIYAQDVGYPISLIISPVSGRGEILKEKIILEENRKQISQDLLDGDVVNVEYIQIERRSSHKTSADIYVLKKVRR